MIGHLIPPDPTTPRGLPEFQSRFSHLDIFFVKIHRRSQVLSLSRFLSSTMSKSKGSTNLDRLTELKFQKLKHQSSLSKKMNDILTKSGGMNDSTHHSIKSINAAIAVAKQPGYFDYYAASDDIKHAEEKKTLNHLAKEIQKVHLELEQLNGEIHTAGRSIHSSQTFSLPQC